MANKIDDYGGNAYGGRKRRTTQDHLSFNCLACGARRYVARNELARAAAPRCVKCGGTLEETKATRKREGLPPAEKAVPKRAAARRCCGCGALMNNNAAQHLHLMASTECVAEHIALGKPMPLDGRLVIPGTVHILHSGSNWTVLGFATPPGEFGVKGVFAPREIKVFRHLYEARDWIEDHLGPVELAR